MVKYIRGSETNDGKRLVKSNGQIVFNASPEEYLAEGWSDYTVMLDSSKGYRNPVKEEEPVQSGLELKENLIAEIDSYYSSIADKTYLNGDLVTLNAQDRIMFQKALESALELEIVNIEFRNKIVSVEEAIKVCKHLNYYWLTCYVAKMNCIQEVQELKTQKEILEYDYIDKFPEIPSFSL